MHGVDFTRNLVKGRIAETIFVQMLYQTGDFTVIEFGYEKVVPELMHAGLQDSALDTIRTAPDFAVIHRSRKEVHLVEVKFRHQLVPRDILDCAQKMHKSWNPSYLFLATLDDFYLDEVSNIIANGGEMIPLTETMVPLEVQEQYLKILRDFEGQQ